MILNLCTLLPTTGGRGILFSDGPSGHPLTSISRDAISLCVEKVFAKFQVEGVAPHQPFFFSEN